MPSTAILRRGRRNHFSEARELFCYLAVRELGISGAKVRAMIGMGSSSVSRALRRGEELFASRPELIELWTIQLSNNPQNLTTLAVRQNEEQLAEMESYRRFYEEDVCKRKVDKSSYSSGGYSDSAILLFVELQQMKLKECAQKVVPFLAEPMSVWNAMLLVREETENEIPRSKLRGISSVIVSHQSKLRGI